MIAYNVLNTVIAVNCFLQPKVKHKDLGHLKYFVGSEVAKNVIDIFVRQRMYPFREILSDSSLLVIEPTAFPLVQNLNIPNLMV